MVNGEEDEEYGGLKDRVAAGDETSAGLDRFEMLVDSGITRTYQDGQETKKLAIEKYERMMRAKGTEELEKLQNIYTVTSAVTALESLISSCGSSSIW